MPPLPVVSGDEFTKAAARLGYAIERMRGSHMMRRCAGRKPLTVPRHDELDRKTLPGLIRDAGVSAEEFVELLK